MSFNVGLVWQSKLGLVNLEKVWCPLPIDTFIRNPIKHAHSSYNWGNTITLKGWLQNTMKFFSWVFLVFVLNHSKTLCKSPLLNWFTSSSLKCFIVVHIFIFSTLYHVLKQNKIKFFFPYPYRIQEQWNRRRESFSSRWIA
jgi:hypothetical protein